MNKVKRIVVIQSSILLYSLTALVSKLASNEPFLSFKFCLYYGIQIVILGIYAILWQQILKKNSLSFAIANKATSIIWAMIIGLLFFNEGITAWNVIGAIVEIVGILLIIKGEHAHE